MDIETPEENAENYSFGKEIVKSVVISAAATVGAWAGLLAVGLAVNKYQQFKEARKAKKSQIEE